MYLSILSSTMSGDSMYENNTSTGGFGPQVLDGITFCQDSFENINVTIIIDNKSIRKSIRRSIFENFDE